VALSNIGSSPIGVPEGVSVVIKDKMIDEVTRLRMEVESKRRGKPKIFLTQEATITGPLGTVTVDVADFVKVDQSEAGKVKVTVQDPTKKHHRDMWGTTRSLINNGVLGVSEGHLCIVKFVGTGFRAVLEKKPEGGEYLSLRVGFCVPQNIDIPEDIKVQVPVPHRLIIEGKDKQQIRLLAARIRALRPPEPYKGKGIFVDNETIKLKQRKIK
jgi:large subunit ribosomal protein L6